MRHLSQPPFTDVAPRADHVGDHVNAKNPDNHRTGKVDPFTPSPFRPLSGAEPILSASYLHERGGKRELRRDSAKQGTDVAVSQLADQERTLLFNLRTAFVQILQQKAILALAQENLTYYDQVLEVSRSRRQAGDLSQVDLNRLEVQRVQFETDLQTASVNLRTAKIQLLTLLNDRTPVEQFEVTGPYEVAGAHISVEEYRQSALEARPDLKAALQAIEKARTDHKLANANGTTDPTFSVDLGRAILRSRLFSD